MSSRSMHCRLSHSSPFFLTTVTLTSSPSITTIDGEGFLLQQTNTAQIKSAYARPAIRGKGIGTALLQRAIQWSHQQGYERVFVEHETANVYGGNFWCKYFIPYVYVSMRYIDTTLYIQE
jgi:GNAT superfamily N-acetyltransferase